MWRWRVFWAVASAVFLVGWLGSSLVEAHVTLPRSLEAARSLPGVTAVNLSEQEDGKTAVRLTLGAVDRIEDAYLPARRLFPDDVEIVIEDARTPDLERLRDRIAMALTEALDSGRLVEMQREIERLLADTNLTRHRLHASPDLLFLQLHQGDRYLYEVLKRRSEGGGT